MRLTRFDSSQGGPTLVSSPCPGGRAPRFDRGRRGSTPRREAAAPVLAVSPGAGVRSLSFRVRLPAGAPQGGTAPREAHNLAPVGSIPTPASRDDSRRAAALIRPAARVRLPSVATAHTNTRHLGVAQPGRAPRLREPEIEGSNPSTQTARDERAGERTGITNRPRRVRSPGPAPRRRSPTEGGNRLRSGSVWVRLPPPAQKAQKGVGRYGDLVSLIRRPLRVRLTATPPRGARSLGEHRRDKPDQVGSIPTLRTLSP